MTVDLYIQEAEEGRRALLAQLREVILGYLPEGFEESIQYKMPAYVVPHTLYPLGYHCDASIPLPFINFASQKKYISFYHMGLYDEDLLAWLKNRWDVGRYGKLDVGKCCLRLNPNKELPLDIIQELVQKMTPQEWISIYEKNIKRK